LLLWLEEHGLSDAKYKFKTRHYKLEYEHREYEISCQEICFEEEEPVVFIPEYLSPRRPYPICVYLFAICLYCSNPD
jgi:hypothetical protein